jgi:serine/threonine protein kinase
MRNLRLNGESETLASNRKDEHTTGVGPAASRCLSEDDVLALCAGNLDAKHLPRVDEHLDRCDACHHWVAEVMAHGETRPALEDDTVHPGAFRSGMMAADRFRVVRFIKRGGMGEVYEAFDSVLETRVALKTIISTACDSPRAVRKLKAEVQLARSIRHPNVCSVFDIWEHRSGSNDGSTIYFFTMEFIDGQTLGQLLKSAQLHYAEAMRLARLQLMGLSAAHVSGVVHRDFKSDNVMLRGGVQSDSQVVIMDFGLARLHGAEERSASNDSAQFAGSVAYMAPEQVEGRRNIGPEADVFAFGVVLFEMLTGQLPFVGDSPWTTATLRLTQRAVAPSRLRAGLPVRLDAFVLKCLHRHPEDRFRDAREALKAFEGVLEPSSRTAHRWLFAAALTSLLLAALALATHRRNAAQISSETPALRAEVPVAGGAPAPIAASEDVPAPRLRPANDEPPQDGPPQNEPPQRGPTDGSGGLPADSERAHAPPANAVRETERAEPPKVKRSPLSARPPEKATPEKTTPASGAARTEPIDTPSATTPTGREPSLPEAPAEAVAPVTERPPGVPDELRDLE